MAEAKPLTIHLRIRDLRRQHSLTQEALADALGVSRQSVNAMEAGRCLPSLPLVLQLASYFSIPVSDIFDLDQPRIQLINPLTKEDPMPSLIPWSPLRDMREALDELMDESANLTTLPMTTVPPVNVFQDAQQVTVEMRLPGYHQKDLNIEVGEDFLSISGSVTQETNEDQQYFRREFSQQNFQRTLSLPALVQSEKTEATMKHGVLVVRMPKQVEEKPKTARITIKSEE